MNHREVLENELEHGVNGKEVQDALRAAIELMRAAEPKDEAAEREHCFRAAERLTGYEWVALKVPEEIERAQARAEVEAKYAALLAPKDEQTERETCMHVAWDLAELARVNDPFGAEKDSVINAVQRARAQARAEGYANRGGDMAERLTSVTRANEQLLAQLSTAQAEIERLQNQVADLAEHDSAGARAYDKLETKLTTAQAEIATRNKQLEYERDLHGEIGALKLGVQARRVAGERLAEFHAYEIERLRIGCQSEARLQEENSDLLTKLATAQAEIAQTAFSMRMRALYIAELETKLTNLRTAAERFESWYSSEEFDSLDTKRVAEFCAAIEASR